MPVAETLPTLYGFTAGSTLLTSRGCYQLFDLARMTALKAEAQTVLDQRIARQQREDRVASKAFIDASNQLTALCNDEDKTALRATHGAILQRYEGARFDAVETMRAEGEAQLAERLPRIGADPVGIERVTVESEPVINLVDVVIGETEVAGRDGKRGWHRHIVRCTPDTLFVTESKDVRAADLLGIEILRVLADGTEDTWLVLSVTPVVLDAPIPVYRVHALTDACCIGVDADVFAVVRIPE